MQSCPISQCYVSHHHLSELPNDGFIQHIKINKFTAEQKSYFFNWKTTYNTGVGDLIIDLPFLMLYYTLETRNKIECNFRIIKLLSNLALKILKCYF